MISSLLFVISSLTILLSAEAGVVGGGIQLVNGAGTQIVGGRPAFQGEAPYQLAIRYNNSHLCGATLVLVDGLQVGVTAAHCIYDENDLYILVAGDINQTDVSGIEQTRVVKKVVVHQNHTNVSVKNDIALLFFDQSFHLNDNVKPALLPIQGQVFSEGNLKVSGWGDLAYNGESPDVLQIVEIPLVNDIYCQEAYQDKIIKPDDNMICAGSPTGDVSPCQGDSGGPGISDAGYLAGIVSWGHECGHPKYPAVFAKVAHYVDWIHATVMDHQNF